MLCLDKITTDLDALDMFELIGGSQDQNHTWAYKRYLLKETKYCVDVWLPRRRMPERRVWYLMKEANYEVDRSASFEEVFRNVPSEVQKDLIFYINNMEK